MYSGLLFPTFVWEKGVRGARLRSVRLIRGIQYFEKHERGT